MEILYFDFLVFGHIGCKNIDALKLSKNVREV